MPFKYNPHRHVKIWLGNLNLENRIRLMNMRSINKHDEIHLVYDSSLLTEPALSTLKTLCNDYRIIAKDVQVDIIPACTTEIELKLVSVYLEEIQHLDKGGNLAVASDILRWLKPVYDLGIYSDLDIFVDTRALAPSIEVESSLLLNIGSISYNFFRVFQLESIIINNDIAAVVDEGAAARLIQKIQESLYLAYRPYPLGESVFNEFQTIANQNLFAEIDSFTTILFKLFQIGVPGSDPSLHELSQGKSSRDLRQSILEQTENNTIFSSSRGTTLTDLANMIRSQYTRSSGYLGWLMCSKKNYDIFHTRALLSDEDLVKVIREEVRYLLLKQSVIYTSGPNRLLQIFPKMLYSKPEEFNEAVSPSSIEYYGLNKAFYSKNTVPLHTNYNAYHDFLDKSEIGVNNDLSWLKEGQHMTDLRELKVMEALSRQASFFKLEDRTASSLELQNAYSINASQNTLVSIAPDPALLATIQRLAEQQLMQIIVFKAQLLLFAQLLIFSSRDEKTLLLSNCAQASNGQLACVDTQVQFKEVPWSTVQAESQSLQEIFYTCEAFSDGRSGQHCFRMANEIIPYLEEVPNLVGSLSLAARQGLIAGLMPEAIGDALYFLLDISEDQANFVKKAVCLLFIGLNYSWLGAGVGFATSSLLKKAGCSQTTASITGNAAAFLVSSSSQITPTGVAATIVGYACGRLGFWAEKKTIEAIGPKSNKETCFQK